MVLILQQQVQDMQIAALKCVKMDWLALHNQILDMHPLLVSIGLGESQRHFYFIMMENFILENRMVPQELLLIALLKLHQP